MKHGLVHITTPEAVTQAEMAEAQGKEQAVKDAFVPDLLSRWQGYWEARREVGK